MLFGLKCEETGKLRNLCAYAMSTHVRVRLNTTTMDSLIQLKHLEASITCLFWKFQDWINNDNASREQHQNYGNRRAIIITRIWGAMESTLKMILWRQKWPPFHP